MSPKRVLIVNKTYPAAGLETLKKNDIEATVLLDNLPSNLQDIKESIAGHDGLIWNCKKRLSKDFLDLAGPQLKAVSTVSSGLDHIDLEELKARGITLGHTPKAMDDSVADIGVGLMIAAARTFKEGIEEVASGNWKHGVQWRLGQDIAGSNVGIVGFGGIGEAVVRRLQGFNVKQFFYTGRSEKPSAKLLGVERLPLEQLLKECDFVILSCPLTDETKYLINANTLSIMKSNAVLVNVARGGVVDTEALYEALKEKKIFAAGLDVVDPEPIHKDHPLVSLPNCFIVPHVGSATFQTRNKMAVAAANNLIAAFHGKPMLFPVF